MEFKAQEKWTVQQNLSMTEKQLNVAIKKMIKRHPLEDWIHDRLASNGERVVYLKLEFVEWLKEVYSHEEKYYLDLDIEFFRKQILRLEEELKIPHKEIEYRSMTVKEASDFFDKSINTIYVALNRMRKNGINTIPLDNVKLLIPKEGVKWLCENYFRYSYLESLEVYKLELQKEKRKRHEQSR